MPTKHPQPKKVSTPTEKAKASQQKRKNLLRARVTQSLQQISLIQGRYAPFFFFFPSGRREIHLKVTLTYYVWFAKNIMCDLLQKFSSEQWKLQQIQQ